MFDLFEDAAGYGRSLQHWFAAIGFFVGFDDAVGLGLGSDLNEAYFVEGEEAVDFGDKLRLE